MEQKPLEDTKMYLLLLLSEKAFNDTRRTGSNQPKESSRITENREFLAPGSSGKKVKKAATTTEDEDGFVFFLPEVCHAVERAWPCIFFPLRPPKTSCNEEQFFFFFF